MEAKEEEENISRRKIFAVQSRRTMENEKKEKSFREGKCLKGRMVTMWSQSCLKVVLSRCLLSYCSGQNANNYDSLRGGGQVISLIFSPFVNLLQHGQKHTDLIKYLKISLANFNTQGIESLNDYFKQNVLYEHLLMWATGQWA